MKKFSVVFVVVIMALAVLPFAAPVYGASSKWNGSIDTMFSGSGTESSPYLITSAAELAGLADICQTDPASTKDKYYALTIDIDLDSREWTPIGTTQDNSFQGSFDGRGHTIKNVVITTKYSYVGLFGCARVTDLSTSGPWYIKNLVVSGSIDVRSSCMYIGGIVGYAFNHTISYCANEVNVQGYASEGIGGICGGARIIEYVRNDGSVTALSGAGDLGGISGTLGNANTRSIRYAFNTGAITHKSTSSAGGDNTGCTGGIVGRVNPNYNSGTIDNLYNTGTVNSINNGYTGGIAGLTPKTIYRAFNYSEVSGRVGATNKQIVGSGSCQNCYYLSDDTTSTTNPKGLTAVQMRQQSAFTGFDFDTVWVIGVNYPELRAFKISGTVSVSGTAKYGNTVSISRSNVKTYNADYCTVNWYRSGASVGTGNSYTIQPADIGKSLTVKLTSMYPLSSGTLTSTGVTVGKGTNPEAPLPAVLVGKTDSSITVETVDGQEYSLDNKIWKADGVFEDLSPFTEYTVYTRIAENDLYVATAPNSELTVTTEKSMISGSAAVSGNAEYSRTVLADLSGITPSFATTQVTWMRGSDVLGTGKTYTLQADDIGHNVYFIAEGSGAYVGSVISDGVEVQPYDIADTEADPISSYTFTREAFTPSVVLRNGSETLVADTDYICDYSNNTDAGTAQVIVLGQGKYTGTKRVSFTILPRNINAVSFDAIPSVTYSGSAFTPVLTGSYAGRNLQKGSDYTVVYSNNVNAGKASVAITGCNNFTGTITKYFTINPRSLSAASVTLPKYEYTYTESAITPTPTVTLDGNRLGSGDYDVSYSNNVLEGTAKVTVTGKTNYIGSAYAEFSISGHIYSDWIIQKESTCTETGLKYQVCSGCGDRIEEVIPKAPHTYNGMTVVSEATCETEGYRYLACVVCGDICQYEYVQPYGHNFGEWNYCDEAQHSRVCSRCQKAEYEDHDFSNGACICGADATGAVVCDKMRVSTEFLPEGAKIIAGAYDENGRMLETHFVSKEQSASVDFKFARILEAARIKVFYVDGEYRPLRAATEVSHEVGTGHTYVAEVTKEPTCTKEGLRTYTCSVCGESYTEAIPKAEHTAVIDPGIDATCTERGLTEGTHCSVCGVVLQAQTAIPALGHTAATEKGYAATCEHEGLSDGKYCSVCGQILKPQTVIPALGHNYVNSRCSRCGKSEAFDALAQIILNKGTRQSDGSYKYNFTNSGGTYLYIYYPVENAIKQSFTVPTLGDIAEFTIPGTLTAPYEAQYMMSLGGENMGIYSNLNPATFTKSTTTIGYYARTSGVSEAGAVADAEMLTTQIKHMLIATDILYLDNIVELGNRQFNVYNLGFVKFENAPGTSVTSVSLNATSITLTAGGTRTLTATVYPSTASGYTVTWRSSNSNVASVSSSGLVTAKSDGTATITATAGGKSATCTVTVQPSAAALSTFQYLINYTKRNGELSNGNYFYSYSGSNDNMLVSLSYMPDDEMVVISYGSMSSSGTLYSSSLFLENGLPKPYVSSYTIKDSSGSRMTGYAYVDPYSFSGSSTLSFASWDGPNSLQSDAENALSSSLAYAIYSIELNVLRNTGHSIADLGFTSMP